MLDPELLKLLCCPETYQSLQLADAALLDQLNQKVRAGKATNRGGRTISEPLTAGLVLTLLAVHSQAQLWIIYLVAFGYGVAFCVLGSAGAGLQKDLLPGHELAAANAALSSMGYGVRIVAPLVGAGMFAAFGGGAVPP